MQKHKVIYKLWLQCYKMCSHAEAGGSSNGENSCTVVVFRHQANQGLTFLNV